VEEKRTGSRRSTRPREKEERSTASVDDDNDDDDDDDDGFGHTLPEEIFMVARPRPLRPLRRRERVEFLDSTTLHS